MRIPLLGLLALLAALPLRAQDDLLGLLGEEEAAAEYATASFKTVLSSAKMLLTVLGERSCSLSLIRSM